tara:strand:+ start:47 stop:289 length:243 start_codon:yes stop_codon:yes gene_type:complete
MSEPTKEDYAVEYIKALKSIEDEIEPYKEHRRDLRANYVKNGWLTRDEMRQAVRAYRMLQNGDDINELTVYFNKLGKNTI